MDLPTQPTEATQSILVIGAYGLIGHGITQRLVAEGYKVTGLGRDLQTARRVLPGITWIKGDVAALSNPDAWSVLLDGFSAVVNCSGALQDGRHDDLEMIHHRAISALASTCASADVALVQISAVGADLDAPTQFLSSKARGDDAITSSGAKYHIFRPGLVLASNAYGGTNLLRMLAAVPWLQPIAMPNALIQTVGLDDVAAAVAGAIGGKIPFGFEGDLVEPQAHTLRDIVSAMRNWLGFAPARYELGIPSFAVGAVSNLADALSKLGWRSALRSTAIKVLAGGVRGKPVDMTQFGLPAIPSLTQQLARLPVGAQDRLAARMALLMPIIVFSLCLFWLASGIVALARVEQAALILQGVGWPIALAVSSVVFWALIDIAIGVAFAVRRYASFACWAAAGVSVFYLLVSTVAIPNLWLDPLGPLVKILPGIVLALVARAVVDTR